MTHAQETARAALSLAAHEADYVVRKALTAYEVVLSEGGARTVKKAAYSAYETAHKSLVAASDACAAFDADHA